MSPHLRSVEPLRTRLSTSHQYAGDTNEAPEGTAEGQRTPRWAVRHEGHPRYVARHPDTESKNEDNLVHLYHHPLDEVQNRPAEMVRVLLTDEPMIQTFGLLLRG